MWMKLRTHLKDFKSSQKRIKETVNINHDLLEWATKNGQKYQLVLNKIYFDALNKLSLDKKTDFLNFITDCKDKDLYVVIVNSKSVVAYKPSDRNSTIINKIEAKDVKKTDVGYTIFINSIPAYRVQTVCTNGIGISAFCQRFFITN